jgi:RNA polymerase sigma factor (sigma-70 family)
MMMEWVGERDVETVAATSADETARERRPGALTGAELTRVFLQIRPSLQRVIQRRVGDAQTAQDLAQELYFRLERVADQLPDEDEARRYLMRMATNAAIDHLRVEGNRVRLLAGALCLFEGHAADPEMQAQTQERLQIIEVALAELPPKCREVLILSRLEGLTHGEIAKRLGVSHSLVEKYVLRTLLHCRARLRDR